MPSPAAAADSWERLAGRYLHPRRDGLVLVGRWWARADAWTVSQVAAAAVTRAGVRPESWDTVDGLFGGLADHLFRDAGFTAAHGRSPGPREMYYDDNAWIGLASIGSALLRARWGSAHLAEVERDLARARLILRLLNVGEHPDGGVLWRVGGDTRNACSTGPAGILALRVRELERQLGIGAHDHEELVAFARRCAAFVDRLVDDDGMVADHLRADGTIDPPVYAYNQGTAIGLHLQLARSVGGPLGGDAPQSDPPGGEVPDRAPQGEVSEGAPHGDRSDHLRVARELAGAAWHRYGPGGMGTRLWTDAPVFVSILCRNLLTLWAADGDERWPQLVDTWRAAMEDCALDPRTGDYTRNGVGHYDRSRALDRAGVCHVHWARRWPAELVPLLT